MISYRTGRVREITGKRSGFTQALIEVSGDNVSSINYDRFTGPLAVGDEVIVNTTAVELGLGSGGRHFVHWNLSRREHLDDSPGHIVKMRYMSSQLAVAAAEEQRPDAGGPIPDLGDVPVLIGSVHSQLLPAVLTLRHLAPSARVVYVMTDGGALPLALSDIVEALRSSDLLQATVTCGHAFGGDLEAINVYSAISMARTVARADVVVVVMGPGVVGTGSRLGFSAIEQGQAVNAAAALGGRPVAIARVSSADKRGRHRGLSHHTITSLSVAALAPAVLPLPVLDGPIGQLVQSQLEAAEIGRKHQVEYVEGTPTLGLLKESPIGASVMGRQPEEDPEFFLAAGAAAKWVAEAVGASV